MQLLRRKGKNWRDYTQKEREGNSFLSDTIQHRFFVVDGIVIDGALIERKIVFYMEDNLKKIIGLVIQGNR